MTDSVVTMTFLYVELVNKRPTFLPRDAMHKRGLCRHTDDAVSVRLSASVTFVDHVKTNKDIFKH